MSFVSKLRPTRLEEVRLGKTKSVVDAFCKREDRNHAILITGNSGTGKTTLARNLFRKLCGNDVVHEYNSSSERGIDFVRSMSEEIMQYPMFCKSKCYILDECHKITADAQEAMLKMLESVPDFAYVFLITTNPEKLKVTLKRRCYSIHMEDVSESDIVEYLKTQRIVNDIDVSDEIIADIAKKAGGSYGIAAKHLDQVLGTGATTVEELDPKSNLPIDLARKLMNPCSWGDIAKVLNDLKGTDAEGIRRLVLGYASACLLGKANDSAAYVIHSFKDGMYDSGFAGIVLASYSVYKKGKI